LNVFRTWGFNDKNVTYIPEGLPQYGGEGAGGTEVIFQRWANGKSTIDVTAFDKVVNAATKTGIKLVVALTNNWADYGGMDVYTVNLGGKYHDDVCPSFSSRLLVFTDLSIVLPPTRDQEGFQAVCQSGRDQIQGQSYHLRLGARQRGPLRR
jgi:hypothetical protein